MSANAPRVSVILPTYNRAHLLPRAIATVLGQTISDFELIVVDDGSTDQTAALMSGFDDPRIVFLPPDRNLGDAGARNRGAGMARGEWLAFQDSDDEWLPDKLERQLAFAQAHPDAELVAASSIRIAGSRVDLHHWPLLDAQAGTVDLAAWACTAIANLQAILMRRSIFERQNGFDTQYRATADADFVFRVMEQAPHSLAAERRVVAVMHDTPGSLVGDPRKIGHDFGRLIEKHGAILQRHPAALAALRYRRALSQLQCGDLPASRQSAIAALRAAPRYWRPWAYLALSLLGLRGLNRLRAMSQALRQPSN